MDAIIDWPPIVWALRIAILFALSAWTWVAFLYMARFFRPRHIGKLLGSPPPTFRSVAGSAEILGQKVEASATLDAAQDDQIERLRERVRSLEASRNSVLESVNDLIRQVDHVRNRLPAESPRGAGESEGG